jgi:hypothetical protein
MKRISQNGDGVRPDLYDFVDGKSISVIRTWRAGLTQRSRGALDQKLDMLRTAGWELPPKLLVGPINKTQHIYKLRIQADIQLRPMMCKGPFLMESEITLLLGAIEIQSKLVPGADAALRNRDVLIRDRERRIPHERY